MYISNQYLGNTILDHSTTDKSRGINTVLLNVVREKNNVASLPTFKWLLKTSFATKFYQFDYKQILLIIIIIVIIVYKYYNNNT